MTETEHLLALYRQGAKLREMADALGVSAQTVHRRLASLGMSVKDRKKPPRLLSAADRSRIGIRVGSLDADVSEAAKHYMSRRHEPGMTLWQVVDRVMIEAAQGQNRDDEDNNGPPPTFHRHEGDGTS